MKEVAEPQLSSRAAGIRDLLLEPGCLISEIQKVVLMMLPVGAALCQDGSPLKTLESTSTIITRVSLKSRTDALT